MGTIKTVVIVEKFFKKTITNGNDNNKKANNKD